MVVFDNSVEARQKRREDAKILAEQYFKAQEWDKISVVLKPFVDKGETDFIFKKIFYDCSAAKYYLVQGLSSDSLSRWKKAFDEINEVIADSRFIRYQENLNRFVDALHNLMNNKILEAAKTRVYSTGEDDICALFDSVITENDEVFIFYKVNYEYQLINYRYEAKWVSGLYSRMKIAVDELEKAYYLAETQKNLIMVKVKNELSMQLYNLYGLMQNKWITK